MVKLRDITEMQTGIYAKPSLNPETVYLQVNEFDSNGVIYDTAKPSIATSEINAGHYLNIGDLLFAAKGTKNFCTIFPGWDDKCVVSSSFLVIRITKEDIVESEYINWYLNLSTTIAMLGSNAVGSAIPSITKATLGGIDIPLPSISTQKQIVEIAELQKKERKLQELIIVKRQQITDYKLKNIISNGK